VLSNLLFIHSDLGSFRAVAKVDTWPCADGPVSYIIHEVLEYSRISKLKPIQIKFGDVLTLQLNHCNTFGYF